MAAAGLWELENTGLEDLEGRIGIAKRRSIVGVESGEIGDLCPNILYSNSLANSEIGGLGGWCVVGIKPLRQLSVLIEPDIRATTPTKRHNGYPVKRKCLHEVDDLIVPVPG